MEVTTLRYSVEDLLLKREFTLSVFVGCWVILKKKKKKLN